MLDTQAPHQLNDGQYAQRRATCEKAAEILGVANLRGRRQHRQVRRSVPGAWETLDKLEDDTMKKRVRHVITEIARVNSFVRAFANGKIDEAGRLFNASRDSLAADYEVTVPELDIAVDVARVQRRVRRTHDRRLRRLPSSRWWTGARSRDRTENC